MKINKENVTKTIEKIKNDPKYNKAFDPANPEGYVMIAKQLFESVKTNNTNFKSNLEAFAKAVNSSNHTHLYNIDKAAIVNELSINDFKNLVGNFDKGYEIMNRIQRKCSRSVYSFLTKLFSTYCGVNFNDRETYPKFDRVLKKYLPKYYFELFGKKISIGTKLDSYPKYIGYIDEICKACNVDRFELDQFIWYNNK